VGDAVVGTHFGYSAATAAMVATSNVGGPCSGFSSTVNTNCLGDVLDATDSSVTLSLTLFASTWAFAAGSAARSQA
jgi:hypothetical protein